MENIVNLSIPCSLIYYLFNAELNSYHTTAACWDFYLLILIFSAYP